MKIKLKVITVKELAKDYVNNHEEGVIGYGGKLDIRPKYQREFIYSTKDRDAVIDTLHHGYPLNVMYWSVRDDGNFEVIDGQQRTISICQYVIGDFSCRNLFGIKLPRAFHNLQDDEQQKILNYKLTVYECSGTDSEKLAWFRTINIAGKVLTDQELRNATYSGSWVTDAKRYFSKSGCAAYGLGSDYLTGSPIRQEYLETAIKWISNGDIEAYMQKNQTKTDAKPLWDYFQAVINWVQTVFPKYRKEMKGLNWGEFYNQFKDKKLNSTKLEKEIAMMMASETLKKKSGIYEYLLTGEKKHLQFRTFTDSQKRTAYERQKGICEICKKKFPIEKMHGDHIDPWAKGGATEAGNCQMLCVSCNLGKGVG